MNKDFQEQRAIAPKPRLLVRYCLVVLLSLCGSWVLVDALWGLVGGVAICSLRSQHIVSETAAAQQEYAQIAEVALRSLNWLPATLLVSVISFGLVGFATAGWSGKWYLGVLVWLLCWFTHNPLIRFELAATLPLWHKALVLTAQLASLWLGIYIGMLRWKRGNKRKAGQVRYSPRQ